MSISLRRLPTLLLPLALAACDQFEDPDVARIDSLEPDSGAIGSLVIVHSDNLFNNTLVFFHDDVQSKVAAVFSDERIVTIVPEGATTGDVRVETAGERGADRAEFRIVPPPPSTPAFFEDDTGQAVTDYIPCAGRNPLDDGYATFTLPFAFPFYGREQAEMFVSTNGLISFGTPTPCDNNGNTADFVTADKIVVLGFDLSPGNGGQVLVNVADPSQVVVTWSEVALFNLGETSNTFQALLFPDGRIQMNYGYISTRGIGGTQPVVNGISGVQSPVEFAPTDAIVDRFFVDRFFDLENRSLLFTPLESGGVFAGYRAELLP
jgi:hypothetical protein